MTSANSESIGLHKCEIETPALCLDIAAYRRNVDRILQFLRGRNIAWRPHMKGQKAPELARLAIDAGAIGVTCATLYEAEAMAESGIQSILLAHQVAGERKSRRLARLQRKAVVISATDSLDHALLLQKAALAEDVNIPVVIELDVGMNRCGVVPGNPTLQLARTVQKMDGLRLAGLMGWEGHILKFDPAEKRDRARTAMTALVENADRCRQQGLPIDIVSAAGSGTFLVSCETPGITEVQAGGAVFSDLSYQNWGLHHEFAVTVVARTVSRPSPTRVIVDAGFKTMSYCHGMPRPIGLETKSVGLSAEHGTLELEQPSDTPHVGDTVEFIPGYTDSTLCLHDEICVFRGERVEAVWIIPGRSGRR